MSKISRRQFIQSAAAISTARILLGGDALNLSNLGVQLYTVRKIIVGNAPQILKAIENIGFREIEGTHETLDKIWPALQHSHLRRVSLHMNTALFLEGGAKLDAGIAAAKERGFEYVVVPYLARTARRHRNLQKTGNEVKPGRQKGQGGRPNPLLSPARLRV